VWSGEVVRPKALKTNCTVKICNVCCVARVSEQEKDLYITYNIVIMLSTMRELTQRLPFTYTVFPFVNLNNQIVF